MWGHLKVAISKTQLFLSPVFSFLVENVLADSLFITAYRENEVILAIPHRVA